MSRLFALVALFAAFVGCRPPSVGARLAPIELQASDGTRHRLPPGEGGALLTVLVFSAWHCPCQTLHDPRLAALYSRFHPAGVDFFLVDSEIGGTYAEDAAKAKSRGYPFPVLLDPGAGLARTLHAEYATESFVIDRLGMVRYHGGIDTDRTTIHKEAVPLLGNALDDTLSARALRSAETNALGCALQTW
jgi:hypothetical protein